MVQEAPGGRGALELSMHVVPLPDWRSMSVSAVGSQQPRGASIATAETEK